MLNDGQLAPTRGYGWGHNNADGSLGICSAARAPHPVPVQLPGGTIDVQGGTDFTIAPIAGALRPRRGSGSARGATAGPCDLPRYGAENTSEAELTGGVIPA
jgi:hypothetical protein